MKNKKTKTFITNGWTQDDTQWEWNAPFIFSVRTIWRTLINNNWGNGVKWGHQARRSLPTKVEHRGSVCLVWSNPHWPQREGESHTGSCWWFGLMGYIDKTACCWFVTCKTWSSGQKSCCGRLCFTRKSGYPKDVQFKNWIAVCPLFFQPATDNSTSAKIVILGHIFSKGWEVGV